MSTITNLTRMWLTRSRKPFIFTNEFDQHLPFEACENLGLYVHIPFCRSICNFCPYCKVLYSKELCDHYIDTLLREIHIVGRQSSAKKTVTSLYFGGGTPALAAERLPEIIEALKQYFIITEGIGIELHPEDVTAPPAAKTQNCRHNKNQHRHTILPKKISNTPGPQKHRSFCNTPRPKNRRL